MAEEWSATGSRGKTPDLTLTFDLLILRNGIESIANSYKNLNKLVKLIHWPGLQGRIHVEAGRLTISKISLLDSGMYQCVSENEHGAVYASAELKVVGKQFVCLVSLTMS